jgi:hypothetical protein
VPFLRKYVLAVMLASSVQQARSLALTAGQDTILTALGRALLVPREPLLLVIAAKAKTIAPVARLELMQPLDHLAVLRVMLDGMLKHQDQKSAHPVQLVGF